jgi:recombination protein RecA
MSKTAGIGAVVDLASALTRIEQEFGEGAVVSLTKERRAPVAVIPTGALSLDLALGVGGVPRGRVVEVYGPESSGKTTLTYHVIAEAQRAGGLCAFIDAEHSMDPGYAAAIGVDVEALMVSQPDSGEQALEIVDILVRSGELALVVIDSVAALVPKAELEGRIGDQTVGLQARMMGQALRKLVGNLREHETTCLFTNQLREKIGVVYGPKETQPGGRALKFYASQRLDIRRIETLKEGESAVGNRVRVKVVKNKVAAPFAEAEFDIEFGAGISKAGSILDLAVEHGVVKRRGALYLHRDDRLGQGRAKAKAALELQPALTEAIGDEVRSVIGGNGGGPTQPESGEAARRADRGAHGLPSGEEQQAGAGPAMSLVPDQH